MEFCHNSFLLRYINIKINKWILDVYIYFLFVLGESEMKVNLDMLTGKISQGTGTIAGYKEDSKNLIKPGTLNILN